MPKRPRIFKTPSSPVEIDRHGIGNRLSGFRLIINSKAASSGQAMIRKLASGKYRLYSRKKDPKTGRRRNLGTFNTRPAAEKHERAVQYFKRH
jgi:hypothetical protein